MMLSEIFRGIDGPLDVLFNPNAAPPRSELLSIADHDAAMREISGWPGYGRAPLVALDFIASGCGVRRLWYKDESARFGLGSFKALGGAYAVLRVLQREVLKETGRKPESKELRAGSLARIVGNKTVTTATDGNHGRSVAWGAQQFGCKSIVYIPKFCSPSREAAITRFGAVVVRTKVDYDETVRICAREASRNGFIVVSDTSWPGYSDIPREVMSGYTVMAEEALQQLPKDERLTHVFVQVGVGGLAAAVCVHLSNRLGPRAPLFIAVEPSGTASLFASIKAGKRIPAPLRTRSVMAGLDAGEISSLAWDVLSECLHAVATVSDEVVAPCMRLLAKSPYGIVAGESAVAGLAALILGSRRQDSRSGLELDDNSRVLVFGTEGNTDPELYDSLVREH